MTSTRAKNNTDTPARSTRRWRRPIAALAAGVLVLALGACSDDDNQDSVPDDSGVTTTTEAVGS